MISKVFLAVLLLCSIVTGLHAQEVEIKDNSVLLNGKEILKCKKTSIAEYSFYTTKDEEFLTFRWSPDYPPYYKMGDFFILNFLLAKKKIESTLKTRVAAGMGTSAKKNMQKIVNWLLAEKVLTEEGELDLAKLDTFYQKYDEHITK